MSHSLLRWFAAVVFCASLGVFASQAAAVNVEATFDSGASLSDFGFTAGAGTDPNTNVAGGVWDNDMTSDERSYWVKANLPSEYVGNVVHTSYEIDVDTFSSADFDVMLVNTRDSVPDYFFALFLESEEMVLREFSTGSAVLTSVQVANTDSLEHTYGWELNQTGKNLKLFFDDVQVGSVGGYDVTDNLGLSGTNFELGDGATGGGMAHREVWDVVAIGEGPIPEPTALLLMSVGLLAIGTRKYRLGHRSAHPRL